jgi:hypothetical protein
MRPMPTIADALYRKALKNPRWYGAFKNLATVKKFVLESDVYGFLDATMRGKTIEDPRIFSNVLKMARMPYPSIWIEPEREEVAAWVKGDRTALAWYAERHPSDETTALITPIMYESDDRLSPCPFSVCFTCSEDGVAHWPGAVGLMTPEKQNLLVATVHRDYGDDPPARLLVREWFEKLGMRAVICTNEHHAGLVSGGRTEKELQGVLIDVYPAIIRSWMNFVILLATIDELPVISRDVKPSRGYFARGKHRDFFEHRTVRLSIPVERATKKLANHLLMPSRRKRHEVRGHWRRLTEDSPVACRRLDHDWFIDGPHRLCLKCGSEGKFIADHERGDATLGYVLHDYRVTRK